MSQQIRQRHSAGGHSADQADSLMMKSPGGGLSAKSLLESSPGQHGPALKLHVPAIYQISPTCFQRILSSGWVPGFMAPHWTERHLVQLGSFLYRFTSERSSEPKGSPIQLETVEARVVSEDEYLDGLELMFQQLPAGYDAVFVVSTFDKTQYFAVSSEEESTTWVNSMREGRQAAITRSLGHSSNVPYPKSWEYFDRLGASLMKRKERIKHKMAEKEMEMTSFDAGSGGSLPRGYYG
jgi:hypothetical protein|mmetsp:Transcript_3135/g.8176  ORF Transcript_3135/g.8176 Transcript_3135/m.8176 type:complete len:238 (-) Transcript_3135:82-795(-)|eukprot:CAMPEP_0113547162 /NCGR_PEP_ID=MMETSP0015_2-20120614/12205_1 /TAXON_ID=2838 /ORGANISM="Odontella" /LENGTH=237 /DNA_ID=CAMNT_0000447691 /DNA_START=274 /DNA_END=987 /DNA_ORIENTATION=+ /assembly_acc=CAM_ASM_000160